MDHFACLMQTGRRCLTGLSLKSPIQRAARNLQATCMHGFLLYDAGMEIYGKVLLGQDPRTPLI